MSFLNFDSEHGSNNFVPSVNVSKEENSVTSYSPSTSSSATTNELPDLKIFDNELTLSSFTQSEWDKHPEDAISNQGTLGNGYQNNVHQDDNSLRIGSNGQILPPTNSSFHSQEINANYGLNNTSRGFMQNSFDFEEVSRIHGALDNCYPSILDPRAYSTRNGSIIQMLNSTLNNGVTNSNYNVNNTPRGYTRPRLHSPYTPLNANYGVSNMSRGYLRQILLPTNPSLNTEGINTNYNVNYTSRGYIKQRVLTTNTSLNIGGIDANYSVNDPSRGFMQSGLNKHFEENFPIQHVINNCYPNNLEQEVNSARNARKSNARKMMRKKYLKRKVQHSTSLKQEETLRQVATSALHQVELDRMEVWKPSNNEQLTPNLQKNSLNPWEPSTTINKAQTENRDDKKKPQEASFRRAYWQSRLEKHFDEFLQEAFRIYDELENCNQNNFEQDTNPDIDGVRHMGTFQRSG